MQNCSCLFFSKILLKRNHSTCLAFLLSLWQPVYRWKVWQEGQAVCEYCAERKLLQRRMIHFITLKSTKSFCIFDLLRLSFHFGRVWSHFHSQFLQNVKKEKKKKNRVPIILVLITDKRKWFWSYNTRDYHLLFFFLAIYSSCCLLNEGKLRWNGVELRGCGMLGEMHYSLIIEEN